MIRSTDPSKNVSKNPPTPQFHDKTVQSNILWLNLKKINKFLQSAHKQGNPSFHFHAPGSKCRYSCTQSTGCPKIFCLSAPVLSWLSHLTCISSLKAKNERKTFIFTQLKLSRYDPHFLAIFRPILIN